MFDVQGGYQRKIAKIGVLIFVGLGLSLVLIQLTCRTPADSQASIEKSAVYKEHDDFCLNLPRPTDFELVDKMVGGNGRTIAISYRFSSGLGYTEVKDFIGSHLTQEGWTGTGAVFTKDHYKLTVDIDSAVSRPKRYSIYCAREIP